MFIQFLFAESYVFAEPRVTIFAHGLDGTLPSIARDLAHGDHRPLQHLDPDLNLNQSTGVVFNLQTRHGVLIDGIDLHTKKLSENTKCAVFYRNGSFEGFENDLSAWYQVPCAVADNDLASLTRLELGVKYRLCVFGTSHLLTDPPTCSQANSLAHTLSCCRERLLQGNRTKCETVHAQQKIPTEPADMEVAHCFARSLQSRESLNTLPMVEAFCL